MGRAEGACVPYHHLRRHCALHPTGAREDGTKDSAGPSPAAGQQQREPAPQPSRPAAAGAPVPSPVPSFQASIGSLAQEAKRADRAPNPAPAVPSVGQRGGRGPAPQSRQVGASLGPRRDGNAELALLPAPAGRCRLELQTRKEGAQGAARPAPATVRGRSMATPLPKPQSIGAGTAAAAQSGPSAAAGRLGREGRAVRAAQDLDQDHDARHGGGAVVWAIWGGGKPSQAAAPAEGPPLRCRGSPAVQAAADGLAEVPQRDSAADNGRAGAGHRRGVLLESSDSKVYISDAEDDTWEEKLAESWHGRCPAGCQSRMS